LFFSNHRGRGFYFRYFLTSQCGFDSLLFRTGLSCGEGFFLQASQRLLNNAPFKQETPILMEIIL